MPKFVVSGYLTISVSKEITAETEAEAREKAEQLAAPSLCYHCGGAGKDHDSTWELNGFDDPPDDVVMYVEQIRAERGGRSDG